MSKMANRWESPIGAMLPYLQWSELTDGEINTWEIARHNHASYELHIILSGQCRLFVDDTELTLGSGQGILLAPEVFHGPDDVLKPFCRLSLAFFPEERQLRPWLPGENGFLLFSADKTVTDQCEAILEELRKKDSLFHKELLSGQFAQLMLRVFRAVQENASDVRTVTHHPKQLEDMTVIDRFFVQTPPKQRTKENLAKLLHCSQRQVLRKIYALYGVSFQKKQMLSRIDSAQHLLQVTDKSIEEICALVGYADAAAFYKAFKQYTNTTPVKYRKQVKKQP